MADCPVCEKTLSSYKGYATHFAQSSDHEGHPLVALVGGDRIRDLYSRMSENAVANELGVSRRAVEGALNALDIERRGQSEAEQLKWEQMDEEEREAQVRAAHEKTRDLAEDGGHVFQKLWEENPEEMQKHASRVAALGTPAREENGMAGVTGQDHPLWRGGKSVYDAVKKQLPGPSWNTLKDRYRESECAMCGATQDEADRALDVHHIVPLLCGGTNEEWNFITLCMSCHHRAEWYTRDILNPVLTE